MAQAGFTKLSVQGYRRLADVTVDFTGRPLAVLVGANGSGKTSFLKVFDMLKALSTGKIREFLSNEGGIADILTRDGRSELRIAIGEPVYTFGISLEGGSSYRFHYAEGDVPLSNISHMENGYSEILFDFSHDKWLAKLAKTIFYRDLDISKRSPIRSPQALSPGLLPFPDGDETISALYNMRESDANRFEVVEDTLKVVFPDFERLTFPAVAAGRVILAWKDRNYDKPFYINELSEGTVRFLWLCAILYSPELPEVVLIDEPEVSMHPSMLRMLVSMLREASLRSQIIVATHSEKLVSFLKPEELLVCDQKENGTAEFAWADSKTNLASWLEDYTLGQIWSMNIFGGRP